MKIMFMYYANMIHKRIVFIGKNQEYARALQDEGQLYDFGIVFARQYLREINEK